MKLTKLIKGYYYTLYSRYKSLRGILKLFLLLSLITVIATEFFLNKYPAYFQWQYDLGIVILKLSYSYLSAFIFYYLVVFLPKERKRVRTFILINNNIGEILSLQKKILLYLFREVNPIPNIRPNNFSDDVIKEICMRINPKDPIKINYFGEISFINHYEFMSYFLHRMKVVINELLVLYDLLDDEMLYNLALINNHIKRLLEIDITKSGNRNLEFYSMDLVSLNKECTSMRESMKKFHLTYYLIYSEKRRNGK